MAQRRILLAFVMLLVVVGAFVIWQKRPVSHPMRLELTGTPGLKVAGTVVEDGVARDFAGVLPATITAEARSFEYTIKMQEPHGELTGELIVGDGVYGSSSTANDFTGVQGAYVHTWTSKGGGFTTARKRE